MKKIFRSSLHCYVLVVAMMASVAMYAQTNSGAADADAGVAIETFTDMQVVKENGKNILLKVTVDVPSDYPELQKYICSKMFGTDDNSLEKGYIKYLSRHEVVKDAALATKMAKDIKDVTTLEITASGYKPGAYLSYDAILLNNGEQMLKEYYILFDLQTRKVMGYHDVFATDEFALKPEREKDWNFALAPDEGVLYAFPVNSLRGILVLTKIRDFVTDNFKKFIDWNNIAMADTVTDSDNTLMDIYSSSYLKMDDDVCRVICNDRLKDVRDVPDTEINALINIGDNPDFKEWVNNKKSKALKRINNFSLLTFDWVTFYKGNLCGIGKDMQFAKGYMGQQAKKKAGTFVEDENTIYRNSDCDERAPLPRAIRNIVRGMELPKNRFTYVRLLIDKDGGSVVPILENDMPDNGVSMLVGNSLSSLREMTKCTPGKKNGKKVHTVIRIKFMKDDSGKPLVYEVPDDEVAE